MSDHYITITERKVFIRVTPNIFHKVIWSIDHWIQHLLSHYENIQPKVHLTQKWYIKWKLLYKFMRSSKRTTSEIYCVWTGEYNEAPVSPYTLLFQLIQDIPLLNKCYEIKDVEGQPTSLEKFDLELNLYFLP